MFCFSGHKACGILVAWLGIEPTPLALAGEVLTTGPLGKSQDCIFLNVCIFQYGEVFFLIVHFMNNETKKYM